MRHTSGVRGIGLEGNAEYIVCVLSGYVQVICARLLMLEVQRRQLEFGDMLCALEMEAVQMCSRLGEVREVGYGGVRSP